MNLVGFEPPGATREKPAIYYLGIGAGIVLLMALGLATVAGIHMATCKEDSCVIWVCSLQGDRKCAPNTPAIIVSWPED